MKKYEKHYWWIEQEEAKAEHVETVQAAGRCEWAAHGLDRGLESLVNSLKDLVDRIESYPDREKTATAVVVRIQHDVLNTLGNLGLAELVGPAAELDRLTMILETKLGQGK